jgi:serine-protein kinase ATM
MSPILRQGARASPVQLIFATILRHLCASPFAPLVERERKPNLDEVPDEHNWACYVLVKFCRYFEMYQGSVTSHVDMIPALCHVLEQIELNRVADMMWFSRRIWPSLVALMKGRVRTDYVQLLVIFKIILPYYVRVENDDARAEVVTDLVDSNSFKGLTDLVLVIDEHAPLKAGLEPLSMESLRLEFIPLEEDVLTGFCTRTFRHGRAFTGSQAHAWTMLELQADCIFYVCAKICPKSFL